MHASGGGAGQGVEDELDAEKAAEREEAIEYVKTLGGFGGFSLALFLALTEGAGMEDVLAGNIVLVTLCAYGAYLLFFDGGVTQKALENQAIRQLAEEEGEIMADAPRAEIGAFAADITAADPAPAMQAFERDGFTRLDGVISGETASALLAYINSDFEAKRKDAEESLASEGNFGDVLMRENRYDLLLELDPPVRQAVDEMMGRMQPFLSEALGEDAELFELAALISDPRSPRQPVHPDTASRAGEAGAAIITSFVALQDVDVEMGPTVVVPGTQTVEAHERFNTRDDGGRERVALLRELPNHVGTLNAGDANLIDSRVLHCGGGNDSAKRRVLFYMSFRRRGRVTPSGSLQYKYRRAGYALDNTEEWLREPSATAV